MAEAEKHGDAGGAPKAKLITPEFIVVLLSTLSMLGALGTFVYTKLIYKKPTIEEPAELEKKQEELKKPEVPQERAIVSFDAQVVNLAPEAKGQHYLTIGLGLECRDEESSEIVKGKQAQLIDKMITLLGKKTMDELSSIQGKLLLKTELLREFNNVAGSGSITDIYFPTFILQ